MLGRISRGVKNLGNILEWLLDELLLSLKAIHCLIKILARRLSEPLLNRFCRYGNLAKIN